MKYIKLTVLGLVSLIGGLVRGKTYSFANEAAAKPKTAMSAEFWKGKHAEILGKSEVANCSDEDQLTAHDAHMKLANEMMDAMGEPAGMLDNEKVEMGTLLANAITEQRMTDADRAAWETKFANDFASTKTELAAVKKAGDVVPAANEALVKANAKTASLLIANALSEGRILPAAKDEWTTKFANEFNATEAALAKETKKLKTVPITGGIGKTSGEAMANEEQRRSKVTELVNEKMSKGKMDYTRAFNLVQTENPQLFGSMITPELATK